MVAPVSLDGNDCNAKCSVIKAPCWLWEARVNTQAKGTLAKDTLCRNSLEQNLTALEITFEPKCC